MSLPAHQIAFGVEKGYIDPDRVFYEHFPNLESRDFYELCQQYRTCPVDAANEFEAIKEYIRSGKLPWPSYEEPE